MFRPSLKPLEGSKVPAPWTPPASIPPSSRGDQGGGWASWRLHPTPVRSVRQVYGTSRALFYLRLVVVAVGTGARNEHFLVTCRWLNAGST